MTNELTDKTCSCPAEAVALVGRRLWRWPRRVQTWRSTFSTWRRKLQAGCAEIEGVGRRALAVKADVSQATEDARLIEVVQKGLGGIDILVNNVGISRPQPLSEITAQDCDDVLTINLKSMFLVTQAVLPGMRQRKQGRIINPP